MNFINNAKNNLSLFFCFICRSRENGNPESANNTLDSRLRGNDRRNPNACKLSFFKNLKPKTYNSFEPEGSQSSSRLSLSETNVLNGLKPSPRNLQPSPLNLPPTTYHLPPNQGFTLIETLVAISILMVAVASPLTIAQKGLASAIYAKDQIIASYLAQDAIEYIINLSGKNVASECNWLSGDSGACVSGIDIKTPCGTACILNTRLDSGIMSCSGTCTSLNYDESTYIYNHDTIGGFNKASPFTRTVKIEENPVNANEALITVTMSWKDKGTPRTLVFYTRIYNWKS